MGECYLAFSFFIYIHKLTYLFKLEQTIECIINSQRRKENNCCAQDLTNAGVSGEAALRLPFESLSVGAMGIFVKSVEIG